MTLLGRSGKSCRKRLKSVGESTDPCGTPLFMCSVLERLPSILTRAILPWRKLASHRLMLLFMLVFMIFCNSMCFGTVSKALEMSMVASRVRAAGFLLLKPSSMSLVMLVRTVVVECWGLKPCCDVSRGMLGLILFSINRSNTLDVVLRSEMGLYESADFGSLFGFRIGIMIAVFHEFGMKLCLMQRLKKLVRYCIALGPRFLRWWLVMLSAPAEFVFFRV